MEYTAHEWHIRKQQTRTPRRVRWYRQNSGTRLGTMLARLGIPNRHHHYQQIRLISLYFSAISCSLAASGGQYEEV